MSASRKGERRRSKAAKRVVYYDNFLLEYERREGGYPSPWWGLRRARDYWMEKWSRQDRAAARADGVTP